MLVTMVLDIWNLIMRYDICVNVNKHKEWVEQNFISNDFCPFLSMIFAIIFSNRSFQCITPSLMSLAPPKP